MSCRYRRITSAVLTLAVLSLAVTPPIADAKPFKKTKTMELRYGWGTGDLSEFDMYEAMYPGVFPIALVTFEPDGTFTALDTQTGGTGSGVYTRQGGQLTVTIVSPPGPYGTVEYVGSKVGPRKFAGEIHVNGVVWGHWRGEF